MAFYTFHTKNQKNKGKPRNKGKFYITDNVMTFFLENSSHNVKVDVAICKVEHEYLITTFWVQGQ